MRCWLVLALVRCIQIVFGGFSPDALGDRIINCKSKLVITADRGVRGSKSIPLKKNVDLATQKDGVKEYLESVLVIKTSDEDGRMARS